MKTVESKLNPITGYLISIKRDTVNGWYNMEIGLPKSWVYNNNEKIECEVLNEKSEGKIIKISPKSEEIELDDLISFVKVIIETNEKIAEKEEEFKKRMEDMKIRLEDEAKKFYTELDELKETSFKNINTNFSKELNDTNSTTKKSTRGRKKGQKSTTNTSSSNKTKENNNESDVNVNDVEPKEQVSNESEKSNENDVKKE